MKLDCIEIENKVDELLTVLDADILHISENISRLKQLSIFVLKHDDAALGKMLEEIQSCSDIYKKNEQRRLAVQMQLSIMVGCGDVQITLSMLEKELLGRQREKVAEKKKMLQELVGDLKKVHLSTTMLLSESARFNSILLKGIFNFVSSGITTYSPKGTAERQSGTAFMNVRF
jgi:hypothetical protein